MIISERRIENASHNEFLSVETLSGGKLSKCQKVAKRRNKWFWTRIKQTRALIFTVYLYCHASIISYNNLGCWSDASTRILSVSSTGGSDIDVEYCQSL
jgi:hypothetical protein